MYCIPAACKQVTGNLQLEHVQLFYGASKDGNQFN